MRLRPLRSVLFLGATLIASSVHAQDDARALLDRSIHAMGGTSTLQSLEATSIAGFRHTHMLEQSERPEGPYIVSYEEWREHRDLVNRRLDRTARAQSIVMPPGGFEMRTLVQDEVAVMFFGERSAPGGGDAVIEAAESLALGPERVLLTALESGSLRMGPTTEFQGVENQTVEFEWADRAVRLYLNRHTALPTAVEWTQDYPYGMWASWGDVRTRVEYSLWHLETGGLMYPRQWSESRNEMPYRDTTILEFDANPGAGEAFVVSDALREGFTARKASAPDAAKLGGDFRGTVHEPVELAPGVLQIQGMWNVGVVETDEGIVVLETPLSPSYAAQVLDWIDNEFNGVPIVTAISTSDAWPHHAGVREFVAAGVPVAAFEQTIPLLERFVGAPRTMRPDRLAGAPLAANFQAVSERTEIGSGNNRMLVAPIHGEGGERMLAVYFPAHRLLYASDLIQRSGPDADFFMPSYLAEIEALVEREGFDVQTVFAMHLPPTPWSEITATLARIRAESINPS
ncbi:MAG: hypothetical protein GKS06_02555 [Acidobacteria bacterium]|nr:hypothetical protein [Acidobacteriota bacterium]